MVLALDIGATKIRAALVEGIKIFDKKVSKTPKSKEKIKRVLKDLINSYPSQKTICLGIAGIINNGKTVCTPNMPFDKVDVISFVKTISNCEVFVENDAKCAAICEAKYGVGNGKNNFFLLTLGTGIGGAAIIDGKLYKGQGYASEPGHMIINSISLEQGASGTASQKIAKKYGFAQENNEEIYSLAKKGNRKAINLFEKIGETLGMGLLNIAYLFDPEVFIISGGFSRVKTVIKSAQTTLDKKIITKRKIKIIPAKFADDAGLIGAACLPSLH